MVVLDSTLLIEKLEARGFCSAKIRDGLLLVPCSLSNGEEVVLSLELEKCSRFKPPEFNIDLGRYPFAAGLPHVGASGNICTLDTTANFVHPDRWEEAAAEIASLAMKTLDDGINGTNGGDYEDELKAYWEIGVEQGSYPIYVCDEPTKSSGIVYGVVCESLHRPCVLVASSKPKAVRYAQSAGAKASEASVFPCLYCRLSERLRFPLPLTVLDWYRELLRSGDDAAAAYAAFASSCANRLFVVVCSVPTGSGRTLLSFTNPIPPSSIDGFRKGCAPFNLVLSVGGYGKKTISKRETSNLSQERLFRRGGTDVTLDSEFAIIGCGSLGSNLAKLLCDMGCSKLGLIDNDILRVENIARHVCGLESVGMFKAAAVKALLERSNPNVECVSLVKDANELIEAGRDSGRPCVTVVTAADAPLELHAVRAHLKGNLTGPLIVMWLEPFALAAHALVLNKAQDVFRDYYDAELRYANPVVTNSGAFYKREAGCQSTFMPYSGVDVQGFLISFLHEWEASMSRYPDRNYRFTWLGKLSAAEELGAIVSDGYLGACDYSIRRERID